MDTGITSVGRLAEDDVRTVLAVADAAPWQRGPRPWRFRCTPTAIELYGDGTDRDRTLACGAALLNLRLAIRDAGIHPDVLLAPDRAQPELLATVRPDNERPATTRERQLVRVLLDPARIVAEPASIVASTTMQELRRAAEIEHAWLAQLTASQIAALPCTVDGADLLVVIGSLDDDVRALLRAGQAIQRVVLTAAVLGLHAPTVSEPVATPAARAALRTLIGGALSPHGVVSVRPFPN